MSLSVEVEPHDAHALELLEQRAEFALSTTTLEGDAKERLKSSKAQSTRRAYRADWQTFIAWTTPRHLSSLPATPETIALYIESLAQAGRKVTTISRGLVAISQAHKIDGHESPTSKAIVREMLKAIRRTLGVQKNRKAAISVKELRELVATQTGDKLIAVRNRALLVVGFAGAFRRSELVALDAGDVHFSADGIEITIRKSKTDQESAGQKIGLPFGSNPSTCPVRTLRAWLAGSGISDGALFRTCAKGGKLRGRLFDKHIARVVKHAAQLAGLSAELYAGHSLRSGLATAAARAGKSERDIMRQTRHRSVTQVREYIRDGELLSADNAASDIGL